MKRLECTSPTSMPATDVSIAHLLIHPTIPLPRPWTPSSSMHSSTSTDWHSSTATAGWQWQASAAGAIGALLWPAAATQGRQRWFPSQRTNFCHAGEEEEQRNRGSPSAVAGRWGSCPTLPYGELRL